MHSLQDWFLAKVDATGFLARYPHFAPNLALVDAIADDRCLMAVSPGPGGRVRLHVQRAYFDADPAAFRPVLQHELHHVLAGHLDRAFHEVDEPSIMQVAKEVTANEYIAEPLPGTPHQLRDYEQYGLRPGQDTWTRYRLLLAARDQGRYQPPPTLRVPCCRRNGDPDDAASPPNQRGDGPGTGAELPVGPPAPSAIAWCDALWRFAAHQLVPRQSLRRPSRLDPRCARIGELPGWSRGPSRQRLLVAIDTSSSMPADLFPRIAGELQRLARAADLVVVECDKEIRRQYAFTGELTSVRGRGGTDLRPVFAPELLRRHRPDGVVYFTDGDGPFPPEAPRVRTLWVLTHARPFACPWGARVGLPGGEVPRPQRPPPDALLQIDDVGE